MEAGSRFLYCAALEKRVSLAPREPLSLFVRDRDLLYRQRPGFDRPWGRTHPVRVRINARGLRGPEQPPGRPSDAVRVLALGDSQTWGFDVEEEVAYPAVLESLLNLATGSARRCEVVNAAVPGYSSYQGLRWLERNFAAYAPHVVLVAYNFNNRMLAEERTGDFSLVRHTAARFRAAWRWRWIESSFAVRKLRALVARVRGGDAAARRERFVRRKAQLLDAWDRLEPVGTREEHAHHLRAIARFCRAHGARAVFVGLPEHPRLAAPLDSALARLRSGDAPAAAAALAPYFSPRDSVLLWTYSDFDVLANHLGRRAQPGGPAAWPHLRVPANVPLATAADYNRIARQVAEQERSWFVDAAPMLSSHPEVFMDECHFDARGHAQVAALLAPVVLRATEARADE
jgi:lysophospholipase L1-like esterase